MTVADEESEKTLYEITAFNDYERWVLDTMKNTNDSVIFLNGVFNEAALPMHVIVHRCCRGIFEDILESNNIEHTLVPTAFTADVAESEESRNQRDNREIFLTWEEMQNLTTKYHKIYSYLQKETITYTYEKREVFVLVLSSHKRRRPGVFIVGGETGTDWMSPAVLINLLNKLLKNEDNLAQLKRYYDIYIVPLLNPDGYVYSMKKNRYWGKNRKEFLIQKKCVDENGQTHYALGVNLDRNWYFDSETPHKDSECNSIFMGQTSLSEEETKGLSIYLNNIAEKLMAVIIVRGYGSKTVTIPYGYTRDPSNNHDVLMQILTSANEEVETKYNASYYIGTTASHFYNIHGEMCDWVKKHLNIPIVYTVHLKQIKDLFPTPSHINPLSDEFTSLIKDSLIIAKDIYGPLFSNANKLIVTVFTVQSFLLINFIFN